MLTATRECQTCELTYILERRFNQLDSKCWKSCTDPSQALDFDNQCKFCRDIKIDPAESLMIDPNCERCQYTTRWVCNRCRGQFITFQVINPPSPTQMEICRCPNGQFSLSINDNFCRPCNFQRDGCKDCIDGGGRCYSCQAGYTFLNQANQSSYAALDERVSRIYKSHTFTSTPVLDPDYGIECK